MRALAHLIGASLVWLGGLGCSLPTAIVISQATPNPLVGQAKFAIQPATFASPLQVGAKSEEGYLANKSVEDVKGWAAAKDALSARFAEGLAAKGLWDPSAPFVIQPTVSFLEPGYYVGLDTRPAEAIVVVSIADRQGREIDRIRMRTMGGGFLVGQRLGRCGLTAGAVVAEYLQSRTGVAPSSVQPTMSPPAAVPAAPPAIAPSPPPSATRPSAPPRSKRTPAKPGGCTMDTDCKGDRICDDGNCIAPH